MTTEIILRDTMDLIINAMNTDEEKNIYIQQFSMYKTGEILYFIKNNQNEQN